MNTFTKLFLAGFGTLLAQQASAQILLDNFENTRLLLYPAKSGVLTESVANPGSNAVNSSPTVARYVRAAGTEFDYISIRPSGSANAFVNVADYATGTKRLTMKVYSSAPGTPIQIVLQNAAKVPLNYPNGNFGGTFNATTTATNAWETLTFTYTAGAAGGFDPTVTANDVDQMTMLVAPGATANGNTYYFDDLTGPDPTTRATPGTPPVASVLLDNYENTRSLSYPNKSGVLTESVANPGSNAVNSSPTVARYVRAAGTEFDYISILPSAAPQRFGNVADFAAGTQRISLKFYSPAAGVPVQIVLQNKAKVPLNYPNGNFGGTFNATTTVANAWETLTFTYAAGAAGTFDNTVTANDVDQITMLIAPGVTANGGTYYFDDFMGPDYVRGAAPVGPAVSQLYDNYEGTRAIKYIAYKTSGGFTRDTLNNISPAPAANPSAHVMRYTRSVNEYDALVVHPMGAALADVTPFRNNTLRMTMKVFSPAPGILFQITLQDSTVATGPNYPLGRNSEYQATTTATNAWETLTFSFTNSPSATPSTGLNEIVLLIAPGTFNMRKVYIDDWTGPSLVGYVPTATRAITSVDAAFAPEYPNPTRDVAHLPVSLEKASTVSLAVYDAMGRRVQDVLSAQQRPAGQFTADVNTAALAPGLYTCRLVVNGVVLTRPLSVQ